MAVRLHLKIGLVPGADRLSTSPDVVIHHEPSIGSISRSKGNLYGVVTVAPKSGGKPGEAAALVADAIRDRVLLRRVGGHPDLPREVDQDRQPDAPAGSREPRPGRRAPSAPASPSSAGTSCTWRPSVTQTPTSCARPAC